MFRKRAEAEDADSGTSEMVPLPAHRPAPTAARKPVRRGGRSGRPTGAEQARRVVDALEFDGQQPHVVLVLNDFAPDAFYAGVRTAVVAAGNLARRLDLPLRCLVLRGRGTGRDSSLTAIQELLRAEGLAAVAESVRLSVPEERDVSDHHRADVWLVTYWTTAHAVAHLVSDDRASAGRVVYCVQDFEPGFYAWGPHYARALATYGAGFHSLVNSRPLAQHLDLHADTEVHHQAVFAPALEIDALRRSAQRWRPSATGEVRVFFYARPDKPRNLYEIGCEALQLWAANLPADVTAVVRFAGGEVDEAVDLGERVRVELLGKVSYDAYYEILADTDLGLALMLSPHPGHVPLELPMAGIPTVTNAFGPHRQEWVEGLSVVRADAASIACGLEDARQHAARLTAHRSVTPHLDLGRDLEDAVHYVADQITGASSPIGTTNAGRSTR